MPKFRRRPTVVDAVQFFPGRATVPGVFTRRSDDNDGDLYFVVTIHGDEASVVAGDWVVTEPDGKHHYPVKSDIFARTYGVVDHAVAPLTFDELRVANVRRCEETFHPVDEWSPTDWACAFGGETGEALNLVKKLRRLGDRGLIGSNATAVVLKQEIGREVADAVIYADLLLARLGLELSRFVVQTFDRKSNNVRSSVFLGDALASSDDKLRRWAKMLAGILSDVDRTLEAIVVRCTESDPRSDWIPVIERLAGQARESIKRVSNGPT